MLCTYHNIVQYRYFFPAILAPGIAELVHIHQVNRVADVSQGIASMPTMSEGRTNILGLTWL